MPSLRVCCPRIALVLAVLAIAAGGQDAHARLDTKAWAAAKSEFEARFGTRGGAAAKVAVLETIAGDGTVRAWKLLGEAFAREVGFVEEIATAYAAAAAVHGDILLRSIKGYTVDAETRAKELQAQMATLEAEEGEDVQVLDALVTILAAAPAKARTPVWKLAKPKAPWRLRATAARIAGASLGDKASLRHLKKLLGSEPDRRVRIAALEAMARAPQPPTAARELIGERLADPEGGVVRAAADVVRSHPFAEAAPLLMAAFGAGSPATRARCAAAIEALLADGEAGPKSGDLRAWWGTQDKSPSGARVATIPLVSDGVLFVVDLSNGMKPATKPGTWITAATAAGGKAPPAADVDIEGTLFDRARHELQLAIRRLPVGTRFNVLAYNHGAALWERRMQPATRETQDSVKRWLRGLEPSGSAYVAGALRLAFRMAGTFAVEAEVEAPGIDTVVLLSIGKPTDNSFPTHKLMEPEDVLARVRRWNAARRVVIHTVCFGESTFLRDLAAQNGGTYAHR